MVINMLTKLRRRIYEHTENFNKEIENIGKYQSELKHTITNEKDMRENKQ